MFFQREDADAALQAGRAAIAAAGANQQLAGMPPRGPNHIPGLPVVRLVPGQQQQQQGQWRCTIM